MEVKVYLREEYSAPNCRILTLVVSSAVLGESGNLTKVKEEEEEDW